MVETDNAKVFFKDNVSTLNSHNKTDYMDVDTVSGEDCFKEESHRPLLP
jgi:hypothetical protein